MIVVFVFSIMLALTELSCCYSQYACLLAWFDASSEMLFSLYFWHRIEYALEQSNKQTICLK